MNASAAGSGEDVRLDRVLFAVALDPSIKFGSLEEQLLEIGRAFRIGGDVFVPVFTAPAGPQLALKFREADIPNQHADLWRFSFRTLRHLLQLIERYEIEVVHWSFYTPRTPYLWILKLLKPGIRHYFTYQDSRWSPDPPVRPRVVQAAKRTLFRVYERVFCVSDFLLDVMTREGIWTRLDRLHYFVNTERFRPDQEVRTRVRDEHGGEGRFVIVTVAALIRDKGMHVLLETMADLPEDVVAWLIGEGPELGNLQALARDLGIADRVRFFGSQVFVEPFVQAADVVVSPSLWYEALGLINLEASACGVPIVASHRGGIPEVVVHEQNGLLVTPGSVAELRECLSRVIGDAELRRRMGAAGRARTMERYSWDANRTEYLAPYRRF